MFEATVCGGVCELTCGSARWLSTGADGGYFRADSAVNITVPEGFERRDLAAYATTRRSEAGFDTTGPALLTGVDQRHARGARSGDVVVVVTAGLSNPATLPMDGEDAHTAEGDDWEPGTVNLLVGVDRSLADGTLATLLATAVEAKTATLQTLTGYTGTTSDALIVGCNLDAPGATFAGSATPVGSATRRCVRDALTASLVSRYEETDIPRTVSAAEHGVETTGKTNSFDPN